MLWLSAASCQLSLSCVVCLQTNAGCWNTFAEKCALLQTHITTAQKQIDDVKKVSSSGLGQLTGRCVECV